ncbi:MAG TPA: hypothetical protein VKB48_06640 [Candidatus Acidoferrum sp.]|nr:hypothetical protein [Candidatus Acidoferrum sp.]
MAAAGSPDFLQIHAEGNVDPVGMFPRRGALDYKENDKAHQDY